MATLTQTLLTREILRQVESLDPTTIDTDWIPTITIEDEPEPTVVSKPVRVVVAGSTDEDLLKAASLSRYAKSRIAKANPVDSDCLKAMLGSAILIRRGLASMPGYGWLRKLNYLRIKQLLCGEFSDHTGRMKRLGVNSTNQFDAVAFALRCIKSMQDKGEIETVDLMAAIDRLGHLTEEGLD